MLAIHVLPRVSLRAQRGNLASHTVVITSLACKRHIIDAIVHKIRVHPCAEGISHENMLLDLYISG